MTPPDVNCTIPPVVSVSAVLRISSVPLPTASVPALASEVPATWSVWPLKVMVLPRLIVRLAAPDVGAQADVAGAIDDAGIGRRGEGVPPDQFVEVLQPPDVPRPLVSPAATAPDEASSGTIAMIAIAATLASIRSNPTARPTRDRIDPINVPKPP